MLGDFAFSPATEGAVFACDGARDALAAAFASVVTGLGFADAAPADVEAPTFEGEQGACVAFLVPKDVALALGRRLARHLAKPVRVFTMSVKERGAGDFDCSVEDVTVAVDGSARVGPWARDFESEWGGHLSDLCDGKSYFALRSILDEAIATALGTPVARGSMRFRSPRSLGSPRLDAIALKARSAERVQLANLGGRDCIRFTSAGTTVTSFLDADEARALRGALPDLS